MCYDVDREHCFHCLVELQWVVFSMLGGLSPNTGCANMLQFGFGHSMLHLNVWCFQCSAALKSGQIFENGTSALNDISHPLRNDAFPMPDFASLPPDILAQN